GRPRPRTARRRPRPSARRPFPRPSRHATRADESALAAVHAAGQLFGPTQTLPLAMIIGQVRATAIDLLRGVNPEDDAAVLARVDEALGLPPV
ncbi:hypothetical protein ABZ749_13975, partial [Micromonospora sp. NPDC047753]